MSGEPTNNFEDYELRLEMDRSLPFTDEMSYVSKIRGNIYLYNSNSDRDTICGRFGSYFIHREQVIEDGESLFTVLDSVNADVNRCSELFKIDRYEGGVPNKATRNALSKHGYLYDDILANFVLLDRLEIVGSHRGKGLGLYFLRQIIDYFQKTYSFGFFAMQPAPLQFGSKLYKQTPWEKRMRFDTLEQDQKKAKAKLFDLYSTLGFERVKGTELMVCAARY